MELPQHGTINLEADAAGVQVDDSGLKRVSALAEEQLRLEDQVKKLEELVVELKEQHRKIAEYDLPDAMTQAGLKEFKLVNGAKITVEPFYSGKIAPENEEAALKWLRDNDLESLIKHDITVPLGRGNEEVANEIVSFLQDLHVSYTDKEFVHHSTLKSFIKSQAEAGVNWPSHLFGAFIGRKAKIKL